MLTADRPKRTRARTHRRDIDGLRGLAIALVVFFHVFVGRVSSGVDVFLFIGGVFFFGPQIRNALNPAGLTLVQSVVRILRRLYPALVVVVSASLLLSLVVYSRGRWADTGKDATASLLYIENFHLASEGHDYAAIGRNVSPFQHIWSMSAQFQVYVGSLLILAVLGIVFRLLSRVTRFSGGAVMHWLLVGATALSFWWACIMHTQDQGWNYYSPLTRFWEIGLGGLFGIWVVGIALPLGRALRSVIGVVGAALIICTGLFLDGASQFPGPWTLVPLAGAALVVLAGNPAPETAEGVGADTRSGLVTALLESRPFQFLGKISYSLYLWHWSLLVFATYLFANSSAAGGSAGSRGITSVLGLPLGVAVGAGVIVLSLVLAWLTWRLVEVPLRQKKKPARSWSPVDLGTVSAAGKSRESVATVLAVFLLLGLVVGSLSFGPLVERQDRLRTEKVNAAAIERADYPGPAAMLEGAAVPEGVDVRPHPLSADRLLPRTQTDGCYARYEDTDLILNHDYNQSEVPCAYGDVESDRTMYLVGGSHSEHFLPAMDRVAQARHIKLVPMIKLGCTLGMGGQLLWDGDEYPQCADWDTRTQEYILENPPTDGVFMTGTRPSELDGTGVDHVPDGYADVVRRLSEGGVHTWAVRDTPWLHDARGEELDARMCVIDGKFTEGDPTRDCGTAQAMSLAPVNPALAAYAGALVTNIDLTPAFCDGTRCPGVIGNILVYRDDDHLTSTYSALLAAEIDRQMFGDLPPGVEIPQPGAEPEPVPD